MTNHLHLIASTDREEILLSDILRDLKKFTSRRMIAALRSDLRKSRRDWMLSQFEYAAKNDPKIKKYRFWQEGVDCQEILLNDYCMQKLNYIHENPVRAEIVDHAEDYRYSSAMDYAGRRGLLEVWRIG